MKKKTILFLTAALSLVLVSCGPAKVERFEEVENHETAFVIPIEFGTSEDQAKLMSEEYLEHNKVAAKRIILPLRKHGLGRLSWWFNYEWIPTVRVIKVDRTPVTKDWITVKDKNGVVGKDQGFPLASQDSVGFTVGINITTMIEEKDAAKYLYHFRSKSLNEAMDDVIRGFVQNALSEEIGNRKLTECQMSKVDIIKTVQKTVEEKLREYGIRLVSIGLADEFLYDNDEVQKAIDMVYVNESKVRQAKQAQEEATILNQTALEKAQNEQAIKLKEAENENEIAMKKAENDRRVAEIYEKIVEVERQRTEIQCRLIEAKANAEAVNKWNGNTPSNILPQGASLLYPFKAKE